MYEETMNDIYTELKQQLLEINEALVSILEKVQDQSEMTDGRFAAWRDACRDIYQQISEEIIRVAVVGPIKSGKSTFTNSLFGGDFVKRGAGVVTSIVTRIRSGQQLKAVLYFKDWDEINTDLEQALTMLPSWEARDDGKPLDIRREKDRKDLSGAMEELTNDLLITDGTRNPNSILPALYLQGFESAGGIITPDSNTTEFRNDDFARHREYVGNDSLAVYLKDVELTISHTKIDRTIEIADCQGSDSPNPMHLAMIQDYLLRTHMLVYVISSRTGMRQADIRFLSTIKKMGIIDNTLFVVNCDFSEHESTEELTALVERVKQELSLIKPDPDVFTLSALYNLLAAMPEEQLSKKDRARMAQWRSEKQFISLSAKETRCFENAFHGKLTRDRFVLLLKNHLERMAVMTAGMDRWIWTNKELMTEGAEGAAETLRKIDRHQKRINQIKDLIKSTLGGASGKIKKDIRGDIDRFFNTRPGSVLQLTLGTIRQFSVVFENYTDSLSSSGFSSTLYQVFQEFRQTIDTFMAETINPEIVRFTAETEKKIKASLEAVVEPYQSMAMDAIAQYHSAMNSTDSGDDRRPLLDLENVKKVAGLKLPSAATSMRYSAKIRTEAVVRLGFYSVLKLFKKMVKKPLKNEREEQMLALADGVKRMKGETENAIIFHFKNYRENFKFQYVFKLVDFASAHLHSAFLETLRAYDTDLTELTQVMETRGGVRERMIALMDNTTADLQEVQLKIEKARGRMEQAGSFKAEHPTSNAQHRTSN
jgi:GTPase SAR1 family protein